jgi:hypothetical protein
LDLIFYFKLIADSMILQQPFFSFSDSLVDDHWSAGIRIQEPMLQLNYLFQYKIYSGYCDNVI